MTIKIKFTLMTPSGSVESQYAEVEPTPGGYVDFALAASKLPDSWLLGHGDKVAYERLDQLEDDELTAEDERQLGRR